MDVTKLFNIYTFWGKNENPKNLVLLIQLFGLVGQYNIHTKYPGTLDEN